MHSFRPSQSQSPHRESSRTPLSHGRPHVASHQENPILKLQRTVGNNAVRRLMRARSNGSESGGGLGESHIAGRTSLSLKPRAIIQSKLTINSPGDIYEREADRISEQVMRMPDPGTAASPKLSGGVARVQRAGAGCQGGNDVDRLQMKHVGTANTAQASAPPMVHEVLRSPGQPLEPSTRALMEPRFDRDFSQVRVHFDRKAADSARAVNARAYTVGRDIVFGAAQYAPAESAGRRLLAHELAHVVQQESGRSPGMVQRAEVDDRSCAGLKDIEPDIDKEVNKEIDDARKAAGTPMNVMKLLTEVFQRLGEGIISPIERFIEGLGSSKINIPPNSLAGTKYQGVEAVKSFYKLQGKDLHVVAGAANVNGICVGSDKIGHFFGQGADYFNVMHKTKGAKTKDAESAGRAMEIGIFGLGATGVFSNADLAANLAGLKFYQDLEKNPKGYKFRIKDYITAKWNEQTNPSFYESQVGGVVWSNLLNGTWKGPRTSRGGSSDSEVDFTATSTTLIGNYEWPAGAKSPNKGTITGGAITQKTTKISGKEPGQSAVSDTPVSGISIQFDWNEGKSSGKGQWDSKNEQTLEGTWGNGKAKIGGGTWKLKKV